MEPKSNPLYDVAISFRSEDEPRALELHQQMSENLSVFVYSKRQEELAGTDGLESLRLAFFSQSRLVVVLYRDGWGKTRWTNVEELAIKDRMFNGGWKHLLFVMLDQQSTYPAWLPDTHIRLDYARYADDLVGAIKLRIQELGGGLKLETALAKAQRFEVIASAKTERNRKLTNETGSAVVAEWATLCRLIDEKITEMRSHFKLQNGGDEQQHGIRTDVASLLLTFLPVPFAAESQIVVVEFVGRLLLPQDGNRMYIPGNEPQRHSERKYYFDYDAAFGWCWRSPDKKLLTTDSFSELLLKQILDLHQKVDSGTIARRTQSSKHHGTSWS
jgi:TIR domain